MDTVASLSATEQEYLEIYADLYKKRGQSPVLGKIFGLLLYRAKSMEEGMDQQKIAELVDRSVSTVSRLLVDMEKMGLVSYTEVFNEKKRRERKYYMANSIRDITAKRFQVLIAEVHSFNKKVQELRKRHPGEDPDLSKHLDHLGKDNQFLLELYQKVLDMSKE